jgi:hypothetical protein
MAYNHQMTEVMINPPVSIAAANPIATARWTPGMTKQRIRGISATITVVTATAEITLTFKYRPTPGSATNEVTIGTLTLPIGAAVGAVYWKKGLNYLVEPGGEVVVQSAGASATGSAAMGLLVEPQWELPENIAAGVESA